MLTLFNITSQLLFSARADARIGFLIVACPGGTSIAFRNGTGRTSVTNPVWVRLDAAEKHQLEVKSTSESAETFVFYAVVGSVVGQKTITQEAP